MNEVSSKSVLDVFVAVATVANPVLLLVLGGIGWWIKKRVEENQKKQVAQEARDFAQLARIKELEDKLRDDRIATYNALLEPFFLFFTSEATFAKDKKYKGLNKNELAASKMLTVEYRQVGFKLALVANDEVVRAYNKLMQHFYHLEGDSSLSDGRIVQWLALTGELLLEIRKSMGNESSGLDGWEMIEWFIQDAPALRVKHRQSGAAA
jgi:hypothetical protein